MAADTAKWEFLRDAWRADMGQPLVRQVAAHLWAASLPGPVAARPRRFAVLALAYCRDVVRYQSDTERTGGEDIAGWTGQTSSDVAGGPKHDRELDDTIRRGTDDCDAKARLFVALCKVVGMTAEMLDVWNGGTLEHVRARVLLGQEWWTAEPTLERSRLGEAPPDIPREQIGAQKGRWLK